MLVAPFAKDLALQPSSYIRPLANWHATVLADRALRTSVTRVLRGLREHLLNVFGDTSPALADFGLAPPKKPLTTPEKKAAAADKMRATRAARHTMGKKQKKAIKGVVPATAPEAPPPAVSQEAALSTALPSRP
jgi:hypothetical protein